jgi:hypothetical protein
MLEGTRPFQQHHISTLRIFDAIRRRASYANVAATLALFLR